MDELMYAGRMKIFALEGAAFAGKTTLINYLRDHHRSEVIIIPEAGEYVGGDKNFPKSLPFSNYEDAIESTHFFLEIERKRCHDAMKAHLSSGLPILMDRSTLLSTLFFYSLLETNFSEHHHFEQSFYQHAIELFNAEVQRGKIFVPMGIILLKPKSESVFTQRLSRGAHNSVFSHWESVIYLQQQYDQLIKGQYSDCSLTIKSENSAVNLSRGAMHVLNFMKTKSAAPSPDKIFQTFLGKKTLCHYNPDLVKEEVHFKEIRALARELMEKTHESRNQFNTNS